MFVTAEDSRWFLAPAGAFIALALVCVTWLALDDAPLVFDPSAHLFGALLFDSAPGAYLSEERPYYPPLVHILMATALSFSGYNIDVSVGVLSLLFLAIALASTFAIGRLVWSPRVGAFAAIILALYPATYIHGRSLMLDLPLMAMTACAVWMLLLTQRFSSPGWSLAFGLACAAGLVTKQMFAAVIILPALYELFRRPWRAPSVLSLVLALAPIFTVVAWWYVPRLDWFFGDYREIQEAYARGRGDPDTLSWHGLTYYLVGTWHQATLPFAILWVVMLVPFMRSAPRGLVLSWWLGVVLSSTALVLKDSRFLMPALPAIALMTAVGLDRVRNGTLILCAAVAFGAVQLYAASFGSTLLPEGDVVFNRVESNERAQVFAQHWRLTGADSSVADESGWGGAAQALRDLEPGRIAVVADRVIFVAVRDPKLATNERYDRPVAVEALTCADSARFTQFDLVVVQVGGEGGVPLQSLTTCTAGLAEDHRIPVELPRLLPGASQLIVYRAQSP